MTRRPFVPPVRRADCTWIAQPAPPGLYIAIHIDRALIRQGETVSGEIVFENRSTETGAYWQPNYGCVGDTNPFVGVAQAGQVKGGHACWYGGRPAVSPEPMELAPGERQQRGFELDTLSCVDDAGTREELPPGDYDVFAAVEVTEEPLRVITDNAPLVILEREA